MSEQRHGITLGIEHFGTQYFLIVKARGKLSHQDYENLLPFLEGALKSVDSPNINALVDVTELEGWEARAMWDDFKFVLKHRQEFNKVAIFGNKNWQEKTAKVASWFVTGQVQYFETEMDATDWLKTP